MFDDDEGGRYADVLVDEEPTPATTIPSGSVAFELDHATAVADLLSAGELVDAIIGYERLVAWATARQHELIAAFHARPADGTARPAATTPDPAGEPPARREWAADEVGLALTLAPGAAAVRVAAADRFAGVLRSTRELLASGRICPARARLIVDMLTEHDDEVAEAVQARVLPHAPQQTWGQLRSALTRAITAIVPDPAERHEKAKQGRRVDLFAARDGMATLSATLTAPEATASFEWITRLARGIPPHGQGRRERGSMDHRRADVLAALLTGRLIAHDTTTAATTPATATAAAAAGDTTGTPDTATTAATTASATASATASTVSPADAADTGTTDADTPGAGTAGRGTVSPLVASPVGAHRPLIHVTVPISTLMGLEDEPGELAGYGPIPAPVARELAADPDSTWRRLLTDPACGRLLDYGRDTYRPPAGLAGFVRTRDGQCRYPGCRRPALACELDHVQPWQDGGTTGEDNLCALCEKHHTLKHQPGWQVLLHPDRSLEWTTPTGHRYRSHPVDHRTPPPASPMHPPDPAPPPRRTVDELFALHPPDPEDPAPF